MHTAELFYRKDYSNLFNYAFRHTKDTHLAEDFVHNVFYSAIKKDIFSSHPNPSAWLMVSLQYELSHYYKKQKPYSLYDIPSLTYTEYRYSDIETDIFLKSALTDIEYSIIEMVYIKGMKESEVAENLRISHSALRVRVHRIKKKLQSIFFP